MTTRVVRPVVDWMSTRNWKPFKFQRDVWRAYLAGESGLVHAPTGLGKTYAVWLAPLAEYLHETRALAAARRKVMTPPKAPASDKSKPQSKRRRRDLAEPIRVLWLTPLRALATDTTESLELPVRELGVNWSVERRTSDTSSYRRAKQREKLPTALITTPESLTLLLSYSATRDSLATLRCLIVDEWHELMSTKRGTQTELALARLRHWLPNLRIWGLSATLGNLDESRDVLLGPNRQPTGRLITAAHRKRIDVNTVIPADMERFPWHGHLGTRIVDQVCEHVANAATTLLFTNTRSQAELWFAALMRARPDWLGSVALHHGSLDSNVRKRVEELLRAGKLRCVVCTSSLDLGVDFSPVEQVMQLGSPKGIARFLQRAGRSGHQPGATSRIIGVPAHAFELIEFAAARDGVVARTVEARPPVAKPLDVLAQHLVTIAAGGGFRAGELLAEVRSTAAYRDLTDREWQWTLDFVEMGGSALRAYPEYRRVVRDAKGVYRAADRQIERLHRMCIGTITADTSLEVRTTGRRKLGHIEESFIAKLQPGQTFLFAGRVLEYVRLREMTVFVRRAKGKPNRVPRWQGARFPLSTLLGKAVREKMAAALNGRVRDPEIRAMLPLLELQRAWSHVPGPNELLIERIKLPDGHHMFFFPFEGRLVHDGLAPLLAYRLTQRQPLTVNASATDYGWELHTTERLDLDEEDFRELLTTDGLVDELLTCLNATELARRQFRDIARIAGLVFAGYPGMNKTARQLQASSELFYDVFQDYDPDNLLLEQARREVLEHQLEFGRLRATLERIARHEITIVETRQLTPLAFPLWAERLRQNYLSSERWTDRVRRMVSKLEDAAARDGLAVGEVL